MDPQTQADVMEGILMEWKPKARHEGRPGGNGRSGGRRQRLPGWLAAVAMLVWIEGVAWSQPSVAEPNAAVTPAAAEPNAAGRATAADPNARPVPGQPAGPSASGQPAPVIVPGVIIRSIDFIGNNSKKFTDKVLKQRIGIELGERYDPFLAEGGRRTIIDVYHTVGYTFVQVEIDLAQARQGRLIYTITEGPRVKIGRIRFVGNRVFGSSILGKLLKTKQSEWLVMPSYYSEQAVREDAEKLRTFYYRRGYLGYDVKVHTEFSANRESAAVIFEITEGKAYRVEKIVISGNTFFSEPQLRKILKLAQGQVYRRDTAEGDVKAIAGMYREKGFIDADVRQSPKFSTNVNDNRVTVEVAITEGRQFRIGRIEVTGNATTQDKAVRRILDEYGFTPGKLYNAKLAPTHGSGTMDRYVQMGASAEQVLIRPETASSGDPNQKDVRVDVTEGFSGMIMPGIGVSSDNGIMGQLIYTQRNFDITDWPGSWAEFLGMKAFHGAGESLRIALEPGTEVSRYSVEFSNPYFMDRPVGLEVTGRQYQRFLESYDERRLGGLLEFEDRRPRPFRTILGFRAEDVAVVNLDSDAPTEIRDVAGHNALFGIKGGVGLTDLDDIYQPHRGHVVRVSYEQVGGDFAFGLLTGSAVQYFTLYEDLLERKTVLAVKAQAGHVVGHAPPFERFYAGGMSLYSVRGFDYRGISTRGAPLYKDPVGSDYVIVGNTELVVPLIGENLSWLVFADTGTIDTGSWRFSAGGGIQILIPQLLRQVPMRFEYGMPLIKEDQDRTRRFNFTMGALF
jgi:outer membrane protein insertion porin family